VKFVNQLTVTPTAPPAVLALLGITSDKTNHGSGARPLLKAMTKPNTEMDDRSWLCAFRPNPIKRENRAVNVEETSRRRLVPID
jgi:hypothetical protein